MSLVAGDEDGVHYIPLSGRNSDLEQMLQYVFKRAQPDGAKSNGNRVFEYIARNIKRKMILVVITDTEAIDDAQALLLRRLRAQHEVLFVHIEDFDPTNPEHIKDELYDIQDPVLLPSFIRRNKDLKAELEQSYEARKASNQKALQRLGINNIHITSEQDVIPKLFLLLEKQRHAK